MFLLYKKVTYIKLYFCNVCLFFNALCTHAFFFVILFYLFRSICTSSWLLHHKTVVCTVITTSVWFLLGNPWLRLRNASDGEPSRCPARAGARGGAGCWGDSANGKTRRLRPSFTAEKPNTLQLSPRPPGDAGFFYCTKIGGEAMGVTG